MSKYLKTIVVETDFDGDHVKVFVRPMEFVDLMKIDELLLTRSELEASLKSAKTRFSDVDLAKVTAERDACEKSIATLTYELLPNYVEKVEGLLDQTGAALDKDELFKSGYFAQLVAQVFGAWRKAATPLNP